MSKAEVHMDRWCIIDDKLHGIVTGHPIFRDGVKITSGLIISRDLENKRVETINTVYLLGTEEAPDLVEENGR